MKQMKIGRVRNRKPENRYKRGSTSLYVKKIIITKNCINPDCNNTFEDTINGKKRFCNSKCYKQSIKK